MTGQDGSSILQPGNRNYAPEYSAHTPFLSQGDVAEKGGLSERSGFDRP